MTPLVLQLQVLAAEGSAFVAEVLRKARMVAMKLRLDDFNRWITYELHGYDDIEKIDQIPNYRIIYGDLRAHNPLNGLLIPIRFNPETTRNFSRIYVYQSIGDLEDLVADRSRTLQFPCSEQQVARIHRMMDPLHREWLLPFRRVAPSQIVGILDRVRNIILDWSLELELKGILGDGMTFSDAERQKAKTEIQIQNFQGILGDVQNSSVAQNLDMRVRSGDFQSLKQYLESLGISDGDVAALHDAIKADPKPTKPEEFGTFVSEWIGKIVGKAATGAYDLGIGTAANLLANAIWAFYGIA